MTMLTGVRAFEACWQSIKAGTSAAESRLLMQSMGRLVDNYATQTEIAADLPATLQAPFSYLVDAYLNGYWLETQSNRQADAEQFAVETPVRPVISPLTLAAKHLRQRQSLQPTTASEAATYIVREGGAEVQANWVA
jgi:hypothetical protein